MSFSLAREITGATPWHVDQHTLPALMHIREQIKLGTPFIPEEKNNTPYLLLDSRQQKIISNPSQLKYDDEDFEAVGIININGPITKSGGASSYGMKDLSSMMLKMNRDNRIRSFVILADSGGGSSSAVELMQDTINEVKKTKPVYALITKGSLACSACYGIISACTAIYAEDTMSYVGSVGTMIEFKGKAANSEYVNTGEKHIRLYATKSVNKNQAFEEALNNDNYELLVSELLDPVNEHFIAGVLSNRPQLEGHTFDDGHDVFTKDSVGTFIDAIMSYDDVIDLAFKTGKTTDGSQLNNVELNNVTMTENELVQAHPDVVQNLRNQAVLAERDRVGAWMAHANTDLQAVQAGIASGENISQTQTQEFLVKANAQNHLKNLEVDSADDLSTPESAVSQADGKEKEVSAFYASIDEKLKIA